MSDEVERYRAAVDEPFVHNLAVTLSTDRSLLSGKQGFRTSGSRAEQAGANFLAREMKRVGLTDVDKVPVTVDRWEYSGATLKLKGTALSITPASYMVNGTGGMEFSAPIEDAGTGFAADYENVDVDGKIALAGVDLENEGWLDEYVYEAYLHGAAALILYDLSPESTEKVSRLEDLRCGDLLPTVTISRSQYQQLARAMEQGHTDAVLTVDSVVQTETGSGCDVVGTLKGRSSDQQILITGHYDMYFNGFQADCSGMAAVLGIAKAMVDSGYVPEHDIRFVAHCAENWGAVDSAYDRGRGAWELLQAHPKWVKNTLAMFTAEQAGLDRKVECYQLASAPECAGLVKTVASETDLMKVDDIYLRGLSAEPLDLNARTEGVAYLVSGIPCVVSTGADAAEKGVSHTDGDTAGSYSAAAMRSNLNALGAFAVYVDQTPAVALDFTATCVRLEQAVSEKTEKEAGADVEGYRSAVAGLRTAAEQWNTRIADLNAAYEKAAADGAPEKELDRLRAEGRLLNQTTLAANRLVREELVRILGTDRFVAAHVGYQENVELLTGITKALKKQDFFNDSKTGAADLALLLNGGTEYGYVNFSPETVDVSRARLNAGEKNRKYWGEKRGFVLAETGKATQTLLEKSSNPNSRTEKLEKWFLAAQKEQRKRLAESMKEETASIAKLTKLLQTDPTAGTKGGKAGQKKNQKEQQREKKAENNG